MTRQGRKASGTGIYHTMLRGINQQRIFEEAEDYIQFLDYLYEVKKLSGMTLYAYCLMNNHIHLLLKERTEPLSKIFRRLGTRYAHWFNKKYERNGHLFQDRFKSEPVETDEYFLSVLIYIYQNPVNAGLCRLPSEYEWGSRRFLEAENGMIDNEELVAAVPIGGIKQKELELAENRALEPMAGKYNVLSDKDVMLMMRQFSGVQNASEFQKMPEGEQRSLVVRMRGERVPIRQIARVTGMGKGIVEKWART